MRVSVLIFLVAVALPRRSDGDTPQRGRRLARRRPSSVARATGAWNGLRAAHTLKQAGVPAVAALMTALSSPKGCASFAAAVLADIVCDQHPRIPGRA